MFERTCYDVIVPSEAVAARARVLRANVVHVGANSKAATDVPHTWYCSVVGIAP